VYSQVIEVSRYRIDCKAKIELTNRSQHNLNPLKAPGPVEAWVAMCLRR